MSWAIERDDTGRAVRMVYMGVTGKREAKPLRREEGCSGCGFHFGWHKRGCDKRPRVRDNEGL